MTKVPSAILGCSTSPGAFEEQEGVVVGGGAGIQVQRVAGAGGVVDQVLGLSFADRDAVEGHVVVDCVRVEDQAVVGDHLDAGRSLASSAAAAAAVPSCGQMMITLTPWEIKDSTLCFLHGRIALAEQDLDIDAGGLRTHP